MTIRANEHELAYIAGFLDADGSIYSYGRGDRPGRSLRLAFANCDRALLDWIQERLGGRGSISQARSAARHHTQTYQLRVHSKPDLQAILSAVLPYLRIKAGRAELALAIIAESDRSRKVHLHEALTALSKRAVPAQDDRPRS